jgi:RNA polymerase sigma-70 factor, ECF subfamily
VELSVEYYVFRRDRRIVPTIREPDTEELVRQARRGDSTAASRLIDRHRARLRRMVAVRMDPRLVTRLDPSDVVQEALLEAHRQLPTYLQDSPMAFYPWLRQIAWNRLVDLHRRHVLARHRSVNREVSLERQIADQSASRLAELLLSRESGPISRMLREEIRNRVHDAIGRLPAEFREVLILRQLEQLSIAEISAVLGIPEGTVKSRHFRGLAELRALLEDYRHSESGAVQPPN